MIPRPYAKQLVARFSGKQGYPKTTEGLRALIDAFERAPYDKVHADSIAEDLEIETHFSPEPSEVYRVARALAPNRFWRGIEVPPSRELTREELLRDPSTIALAKTFGITPEDVWPDLARPVTASLARDEDLLL